MSLLHWVVLPLISALIAWGTNVLAIRFLFWPRKVIHLPGYSLQGMIPKRQDELAQKTAEIVERELLQQHYLSQAIRSIDLKPHLEKLLGVLIHERLAEKLKSVPLIGSFIGASTLSTLESMALEEMSQQIPPLLDNITRDIEQKVEIRKHIEAQIMAFDLEQLEKVVYKIASKEFRDIELMGAILGGMIGILHACFWYFVSP